MDDIGWYIILVCSIACIVAVMCYTLPQEDMAGGAVNAAVLVISTSELQGFGKMDQVRYILEKRNWLKKLTIPDWVNAKLIECHPDAPQPGAFSLPGAAVELKIPCKESFRPGIYVKSMKTLALALRDTTITHIVRTNLSTYVMFDRLKLLLEQNDIKYGGKPYYLGPYCDMPRSWVGGWGITMNRAAAKVLLKHGSNDKHMKDAVTPDDILIGGVLKEGDVLCQTGNHGYWWDYNKTANANIASIQADPNAVFIRLKITNDNDKEVNIKQLEKYQEAMRALIDYSNRPP